MPELPTGIHAPEKNPQPPAAHSLPSTGDNVSLPSIGDDAPALSTPDAPASPAPATSSGDRFTILRLHAKGGLGQVSLARDEKLKRLVALKEMRLDKRDNAYLRQRFLTEAEITGQLEHPGIVPIYDLDQDADGQVRYAMRFVQGRTLKDAIHDYHRQPTPLGFRELLQRFVSVCQTVAYAHRQGVIHRDLKPANVILGDYGETLVVDWGLAKRLTPPTPAPAFHDKPSAQSAAEPEPTTDYVPAPTDEGPLTQAGQVVGTPAYMAPEQAAGDVAATGTPADIYSLGAILYELLTGRPPYQGTNAAEVLAAVRNGRLSRPTEVQRGVPVALEAVCLKALARDLPQRYATAAELAKDVEHWLADEPFAAYREPWRQRLARWTRRHRTAVTTAGVALALLLAGAVGGLLLWESAERKRREQAQEYLIQARSSGEADERLALAEVTADRLASAESILKQACERLQDQPELDDLRARLEARRDRVGRLIRFYHLADEVERRAFVNQMLEARAAAEEGLAALDIATDPSWWDHLPDAELTPEQIDQLKNDAYRLLLLAGGLRALDGFTRFGAPEAAQAFHSAIRAFDQADAFDQAERRRSSRAGSFMRLFCRFGLGQQDQLKALPDDEPTSDVDHYLMGLAHLAILKMPDNPVVKLLRARLGTLLQGLDFKTPLATAEKHLRSAVQLNPRHFFHHLFLGRTLHYAKQYQSAELALNACVVLRPDGALGYNMRAEALRAQYWASTDQLRKDHLIKLILKDAGELIRLEPTAEHFSKRGGTLVVKGDLDKAIEDFSEAIRLDPGQKFYAQRGYAYHQKRELDRAIADFTLAIDLKPDIASHYSQRADIYMEKQEYGKAIADYSEVIRLGPKTAKSYYQRGDAHYSNGEYDQASADYREAFRIKPAEETSYFYNRAHTYAAQRQWAKAAADLGRLVELLPDDAGHRRMHASLLLRGGDLDNYRKACRQILERFGETKDGSGAFNAALACSLAPLPPTDAKQVIDLAQRAVAADPTISWFHMGLGAAYYRAGRYDESLAALNKSLDVANAAKDVPHQAMNWPLLAMACHRLGQEDKAREWLLKASQWYAKERAGQPESVFIWPTEWWYDGVIFENLLSEAEGLLKKAKR